MRKILSLPVLLLVFNGGSLAQPALENSQRGFYTTEQVRQARENAEMNRHYESMRPAARSSSLGTISGDYNAYSGAQTIDQGRLAAGDRNAALEKEWNDKVNKLRKLVADRKIGKTAGDYNAFMQAARESFTGNNAEYTLSRMFPHTAADYAYAAGNQASAFYKQWFFAEYKVKQQEEEKKLQEQLKQWAREGEAQRQAAFDKYREGQNEKERNLLRAAEVNKATYMNTRLSYEARLAAITDLKSNLEDINIINYYSSNKAKTKHLNYYIAELETKLGRFDEAYKHLLFVYNEDAVSGLTLDELYHLRMYLSLMKHEYTWVDTWQAEYEKKYKQPLRKYVVPYAHLLGGDIKSAINDLEKFSEKDAAGAGMYNYCKAALLLLNNQADAALKFAGKTIGTFGSKEALQLVVVDSIWNSVMNEEMIPASLMPMSILFRMDLLKRLEPGSLSIAETSLRFNNMAVRHDEVLADNRLVVALGGNTSINETTQTKIDNEQAEQNAKVAEQKRRQAGLDNNTFADPSLDNYMFTDWPTATQKMKWVDLTVKNENIDRALSGSQVAYTHKNTSIQPLYTNYKIGSDKDWVFSVEYSFTSGKEGRQGIFLTTKGDKDKGKEACFSISPAGDQYNFSYSYKGEWAIQGSDFGEYGNKCYWKQLADFNGSSTYRGDIPVANPAVLFNNAGAVTNVLSIKKIGNTMELYINYKMVSAIQINDDISFFNSVTGIGIFTSGQHSGSINKVLFAEVMGNGDGERPIDALWKEPDPTKPVLRDFTNDILFVLDRASKPELYIEETYKTKTVYWTINDRPESKSFIIGDTPKGTRKFKDACNVQLEKIMDSVAAKRGWKKEVTEKVHSKKEKKESNYPCNSIRYLRYTDALNRQRVWYTNCDLAEDDHYRLEIYYYRGN